MPIVFYSLWAIHSQTLARGQEYIHQEGMEKVDSENTIIMILLYVDDRALAVHTLEDVHT